MSDNIEVICPVYFDGKTLRKERDVNTIFTSGFDIFRIMNSIDENIAKEYFINNSDDENSKDYYASARKFTINNCAETYAKANIFDLVMQAIIAFRTEVNNLYDGAIKMQFGYEEIENLKKLLNDIIKYSYVSYNTKSPSQSHLYGTLDGVTIYNEIYFNIFEPLIINCMNHIFTVDFRLISKDNCESLINHIYKIVYKNCYECDSDIDLSISAELKYSFISSILREIMSKYLGSLAAAINAVMYNSGLIVTCQITDPMNKVLGIKYEQPVDNRMINWSKIEL